jgi:predicted alpha/beta superfamily hydrolase
VRLRIALIGIVLGGAAAFLFLRRSPSALPIADRIPPHDSFSIASHAVAEERTINVYTPPEYASSPLTLYPVLYMPDGGLDEDFPHIANTIDSLIRLALVPPMLVVGIANTERRRDLTGPTTVASDSAVADHIGGADAFRTFIRDELMPEIRRRYRTTEETGVVGESLAGLFIVETFLQEPTLFHHAIALSPSVWWNNEDVVRRAREGLAIPTDFPRSLYLASANETDIVPGTARLAEILKQHAPQGLRWYFEPRPDLEHGTIFRAAVPGAFVRVFNSSP